MSQSTISAEEVEKFSRIADEWWDPHGKFAPLHKINPLRLGYIEQQIHQHLQKNISDVTLLDVGCGGGLIAEPLAQKGANVTAIDASEKNIAVAKLHAEKSGASVDYKCMSAEALTETGLQYDIVSALEIVEHVADVELFIASLSKLVKPGGLLFMSTINRNPKSYALAIVGAEYILRWLPIGTHDWQKFIKPSELKHMLEQHHMVITDTCGMSFNPLTTQWKLTPSDVSVNYLMVAQKANDQA